MDKQIVVLNNGIPFSAKKKWAYETMKRPEGNLNAYY